MVVLCRVLGSLYRESRLAIKIADSHGVSAGTVTRTESRTSEMQTGSWFNSSTLHTLTNT